MPRRIVKRLSRQRHRVHNRWFMRPFRNLLANPAYWSIHRKNVTRAFALGLFIAFIPLPIHIPVAAVLALWFEVNIPVALSTIFVSNPLTMVPQYYVCYWVGSRLLGTELKAFAFEMSWAWIQTGLLPIWKPFLLGCLVLGIVTGFDLASELSDEIPQAQTPWHPNCWGKTGQLAMAPAKAAELSAL
jgi:uncharacterized protein